MDRVLAQTVRPLLTKALQHRSAGRFQQASQAALAALQVDERCSVGWHVLALCQEAAGDLVGALQCYEAALKLDPENADLALNLGHLAFRMGQKALAEQIFRHVLELDPGSPGAANNLACVLRETLCYDESIFVSRTAIAANPRLPLLWDTLATTLTEQGEIAEAMPVYDEALRLDPARAATRYNRAHARLGLGDPAGALTDCDIAMAACVDRSELAIMAVARATMLLAAGDLERGWNAYEARLDPDCADALHFDVDRPRWTPGVDLKGRSLLLVGEQGLGDEVLFAGLIPDLLDALGPAGGLTLVAAPRLGALFRRSFPELRIGCHETTRAGRRAVRTLHIEGDATDVELWSPMGSLMRGFRPSLASFPDRNAYLLADPARVAYWRAVLDARDDRPKVGLLWKSLRAESARTRAYAPFDRWEPVLRTPGVSFVNLQYGQPSADLNHAREALGVDIWTPALDLTNDLDEVAALSCALDLTIGPINATTNIAAACGAPVWIVSTPAHWHQLGTDHYPWYRQLRVFTPHAAGRWDLAMTQIAAALRAAWPRHADGR